jgi:hypothetical protein
MVQRGASFEMTVRRAVGRFPFRTEGDVMGVTYDGDGGDPIPSPEALFQAFAGGGARGRVHGGFRLVAAPGQTLSGPLQPGDVLIRRIPEDGYVHVAFVAAGDVLPVAQALERGWRVESLRPGGYVVVVEAGARPHRRADAFARRLLDPFGRVPPGQLVVRRMDPSADESSESAWAEDAPKRLFIILSGGPGLYEPSDKEHDASWSSFVDPVLLKSVHVDARTGKKKITPFWTDDEQVLWLIYKPAYVARWKDDVTAGRSAVSAVKKAGFSSYVELLTRRAREREWKVGWLDSAKDLWKLLKLLPKGSVSRTWFYGHARDDLWLTLDHDGGDAVMPGASAVLKASDVAAHAALRSRFVTAPDERSAHRTHRFVGCNTDRYARAWSKAFGQWTEGFHGTVQFKNAHTSRDHEPSRTAGCTLERYRPTGAEAGEAWEDDELAAAPSGGWTLGEVEAEWDESAVPSSG